MLIAVGYARQAHDGVLRQIGQLLLTYPGIVAASAGSVLPFAAGITSGHVLAERPLNGRPFSHCATMFS